MSWFGGACSGRNTAQELLFDTENGAGLSQVNLTSSQADQYIDWGDGSPIEDFSTSKIHNYASPGQYPVRIWTFNRDASGSLENSWGWGGNQNFLSQINNWGPAKTRMRQQYYNCNYVSFSPYIKDYPVPHTSGTDASWYRAFRTGYENPSLSWNTEEPPLYWDTSYVTSMEQMFLGSSQFNARVDSWNTSNVTRMDNVFFSTFTGNPTGLFNNGFTFGATGATIDGTWIENVLPWDTSNVTTFSRMFAQQDAFASDVSSWDVSNGTDFAVMFQGTQKFNSNLESWDVSSATTLLGMFRDADGFNCGLPAGVTHTRMYNWDTSSNTNMQEMFDNADGFNGDISRWDTSNVTTMYRTFFEFDAFTCGGATGISWDTSSVTTMRQMFQYQNQFNCDIRTWNVGNVTNFLNFMLAFAGGGSIFNNGFSSGTSYTWNWNPSSVTNFQAMLRNCANMNGDIGGWDVSNGETFYTMLQSTTSFDQDISGWQFKSYASGPPNMQYMLWDTNLSVENYSRFLISLANQAYDDVNGYLFNGTLGASSLQYDNTTYTGYGSGQFTDAVSARAYLTGVTGGWTITGDSQV